jgi:hypothetical protein
MATAPDGLATTSALSPAPIAASDQAASSPLLARQFRVQPVRLALASAAQAFASVPAKTRQSLGTIGAIL